VVDDQAAIISFSYHANKLENIVNHKRLSLIYVFINKCKSFRTIFKPRKYFSFPFRSPKRVCKHIML
jgi:hypothetical protein